MDRWEDSIKRKSQEDRFQQSLLMWEETRKQIMTLSKRNERKRMILFQFDLMERIYKTLLRIVLPLMSRARKSLLETQ